MMFTRIDRETWPRREYFAHYFTQVPCTYSATFQLDITGLRESGRPLYPTLLHAISTAVNRHQEFRMACNGAGEVGYYDVVHPCYTIFHKDTETFSNLWTEYNPDREAFCAAYQRDLAAWGDRPGLVARPDPPENTFPVSMVPWASFEAFHLNLQKGYDYLPPIFTMGRFHEEGGKVLLPLAVQVHHAVCDGFHLCRLVNEVQALLRGEGGKPSELHG